MAGKKSHRSLFKNTLTEKALIGIFVGTLGFLFLIAGLSVYFFQRRYIVPTKPKPVTVSQQKTGILDTRNVVDVDIRLTSKGFTPDTVTIQAAKEYNFRILKDAEAGCQGVKNVDFGENLQLVKTGTEIPMIIASRGTYKYECYGQKAVLTVDVK
jgi:hypothetical protein